MNQFTLPSAVHLGSLFSTTSPTLVISCLSDDCHFNRCEIISHCGSDLHLHNDQWCWSPFHVSVGHLYVFAGKISIQFLCPFFNWMVCYWVLWILYVFYILIPYQTWFANIFSHSVGWLFIFLTVSFAVQKLLVWCSPTYLILLLVSYTKK